MAAAFWNLSEGERRKLVRGRIAARLRKARVRKGMSLADAAEVVGASRSTLLNWETGIRCPRLDDIMLLAACYGVTVASLTEKMAGPRVIPLRELNAGSGTGVMESWYSAEEGGEEMKVLEPCAWADGHFVIVNGASASTAELEGLRDTYNGKYGMRVWSEEPDPERQEAEPWPGS